VEQVKVKGTVDLLSTKEMVGVKGTVDLLSAKEMVGVKGKVDLLSAKEMVGITGKVGVKGARAGTEEQGAIIGVNEVVGAEDPCLGGEVIGTVKLRIAVPRWR